MPAEHDPHNPYDQHDPHAPYDEGAKEGYDGTDALLAAIIGEPLAEAAGTAPAVADAEYRSARADVALLREQLRVIGDALAQPGPVARPAPPQASRAARGRARDARYRRPLLTFALGTLAVACAVTVLFCMAWLLAQNSGGNNDTASAKVDSPSFGGSQNLVCSRLVAEGKVTGVEPVPGSTGRERVTLRVTRYYRPQRGDAEVTVVTDAAVVPRPSPGQPVLLAVPRGTDSPVLWVTGEQAIAAQRGAVEKELALSPAPRCS